MPLIPPNPINANTYLPGVQVIPGSLLITDITRAFPMVITYTTNAGNTYVPGQLVRLNIPVAYGMQQANGLTGEIIANSSPQMSLKIDSTNFDVFTNQAPSTKIIEPASLSPAGSRNLQYSNLSTQVAFQDLNDIGN